MKRPPSTMIMTENTFWQSLRRKLFPRIYALKLNLRFTAGVPDCWLSGRNQDLWLELKYIQDLPAVVVPKELLSTRQQEWLRLRYAEGRWVGVLIGSSNGHLYFPGLSWDALVVSKGKWIETSKTTKEMAQYLIDLVGEIDTEGEVTI